MEKQLFNTWITNGTDKPFYARKKFVLNAPAKTGKVTICGLGQFNLFVNGKKAGDHVLDPAWTDYRKYIQYLESSLLKLLHIYSP